MWYLNLTAGLAQQEAGNLHGHTRMSMKRFQIKDPASPKDALEAGRPEERGSVSDQTDDDDDSKVLIPPSLRERPAQSCWHRRLVWLVVGAIGAVALITRGMMKEVRRTRRPQPRPCTSVPFLPSNRLGSGQR